MSFTKVETGCTNRSSAVKGDYILASIPNLKIKKEKGDTPYMSEWGSGSPIRSRYGFINDLSNGGAGYGVVQAAYDLFYEQWRNAPGNIEIYAMQLAGDIHILGQYSDHTCLGGNWCHNLAQADNSTHNLNEFNPTDNGNPPTNKVASTYDQINAHWNVCRLAGSAHISTYNNNIFAINMGGGGSNPAAAQLPFWATQSEIDGSTIPPVGNYPLMYGSNSYDINGDPVVDGSANTHLEVFMLDGLSHRGWFSNTSSEYPNAEYLGTTQEAWFEWKLNNSVATFKDIDVPSPTYGGSNGDSMADYEWARDKVMQIVEDSGQTGVFFSSSDKHVPFVINMRKGDIISEDAIGTPVAAITDHFCMSATGFNVELNQLAAPIKYTQGSNVRTGTVWIGYDRDIYQRSEVHANYIDTWVERALNGERVSPIWRLASDVNYGVIVG